MRSQRAWILHPGHGPITRVVAESGTRPAIGKSVVIATLDAAAKAASPGAESDDAIVAMTRSAAAAGSTAAPGCAQGHRVVVRRRGPVWRSSEAEPRGGPNLPRRNVRASRGLQHVYASGIHAADLVRASIARSETGSVTRYPAITESPVRRPLHDRQGRRSPYEPDARHVVDDAHCAYRRARVAR
jgi:hypothetical protein